MANYVLLDYYGKFISNLSSLLTPLNQLLMNGERWRWISRCQQAMNLAKEALCSTPVLAHYNSQLPIKLAGGVSAYLTGFSKRGLIHTNTNIWNYRFEIFN